MLKRSKILECGNTEHRRRDTVKGKSKMAHLIKKRYAVQGEGVKFQDLGLW